MRTTVAWLVTALTYAAGPAATHAQQVRLRGRVTASQSIDEPTYRKLCPECVPGAPVTIDLTLATEECGGAFPMAGSCEGWFPLRVGRGNKVAVTIGGRTWAAGTSRVEDVEQVGRISVGYAFSARPQADELRLTVNGVGPASDGSGSWADIGLNGRLAVPRPGVAPFLSTRSFDEVGAFGAVRAVVDNELRGGIDIVSCHPARGLKNGSGSAGMDCTAGVAVYSIESITATSAVAGVPPSDRPPYLVVFMDGYGGQILGSSLKPQVAAFRRDHSAARPQPATEYLYYEGEDAARDAVFAFRRQHANGRIALIGYSMGGNSVYNVAEALGRAAGGAVPVDLLVTLDPVTRTAKVGGAVNVGAHPRRKPPVIPETPRLPNVGRWVNVYADGEFFGVDPCKFISRFPARWKARRSADGNFPVAGNHCIVEQMLKQDCVVQSLEELASGAPIAGPCPAAAPAPRR